jgi:hypothetical protein
MARPVAGTTPVANDPTRKLESLVLTEIVCAAPYKKVFWMGVGSCSLL